MSVINKMLRDLDSRQAPGAAVAGQGAMGSMTRGTFSVDPVSGEVRGGSGRRRLLAALLALLLAAAAAVAAWWLLWRAEPVRPVATGVIQPAVAASAPAKVEAVANAASAAVASAPVGATSDPAATVPVVAASALPAASAPVALAAPAVAAPGAQALSSASAAVAAAAAKPIAAVPVAPAPPVPEPVAVPALKASAVAVAASAAGKPAPVPAAAVAPTAATVPATPLPAAANAPAKAASVVAAAKPASSPAPARPGAARQDSAAAVATAPPPRPAQAAAMETLSQAQTMWNNGSRGAAVDTLREALAAAERANLAAQPGGLASFVMLVRELCRMELAEGHTAQVMTLLTRLESVLAEQPDVWALRGNAAQRLGRHQESAAAYLAALKLRPSEGRWMLGAAVSLAAQGQTTAAAEWADKARAAGVVSPEVLNYLRQMGVPLR